MAAEIRILPAGAEACRRAAGFIALPKAVYSSRCGELKSPTVQYPVDTPMRICIGFLMSIFSNKIAVCPCMTASKPPFECS